MKCWDTVESSILSNNMQSIRNQTRLFIAQIKTHLGICLGECLLWSCRSWPFEGPATTAKKHQISNSGKLYCGGTIDNFSFLTFICEQKHQVIINLSRISPIPWIQLVLVIIERERMAPVKSLVCLGRLSTQIRPSYSYPNWHHLLKMSGTETRT